MAEEILAQKRCTKCGEQMPTDSFTVNRRTKDGLDYYCRGCKSAMGKLSYQRNAEVHKERMRAWYKDLPLDFKQMRQARQREVIATNAERYKSYYMNRKDKDFNNALGKKNRHNRRLRALMAYGGCCACCGEAEYEFLAIDHVYNDGAQHRREMKQQGVRLYAWLEAHGYPQDRFQILCHNCNMAKGLYGECPHQRLRIISLVRAA